MVMKQMRKVTDKAVTHVLNTHVHGNHWLGNQAVREAYPDAVIMAHPEMIKRLGGVAEQWVNILACPAVLRKDPGGDPHGPDRRRRGAEDRRDHIPHPRPAGAHSHTDIMIQVVEDSVVFGGDNFLFQRLPRLDDATFKGSIEACRVAARLKARRYVPGHGPTGGMEIVAAYKTYLATLYAEVKKHYDAGKSDFEMKEAVVAKLEALPRLGALQRRDRQAHQPGIPGNRTDQLLMSSPNPLTQSLI